MKDIDSQLKQTLKQFENLPRFPDGRINYRDSKKAAVLTCFVKFQDKILLLKRSDNVRTYKGKWNTVAGYIDDLKPLKEKVLEELREEININEDNIKEIKIGKQFESIDKEINKIWIVHPTLIELKTKPEINLDREHTTFEWIKPEEINNYDIVPNAGESLKCVI